MALKPADILAAFPDLLSAQGDYSQYLNERTRREQTLVNRAAPPADGLPESVVREILHAMRPIVGQHFERVLAALDAFEPARASAIRNSGSLITAVWTTYLELKNRDLEKRIEELELKK